jgi:hypothetical protein
MSTSTTNRDVARLSELHERAGEVGPRRGTGLSTGPFPRPASRTRRAHY